MYGIIDCDNCYVSCEKVFRPDLEGKPVVVLSNNDGCVVARSNEAKLLGIKAGTPYYQLAQRFPNQKITVFSSNYELYGEMTGRVVDIIRKEAPAYFRYSIDECFVYLKGMEETDLKAWGERLHRKVRQWVGMPVSIGIAPNKTLAKVASHFAKKLPGYRHCCLIDDEEKRVKALRIYPMNEVWGIGRKYAAKLEAMGVKTAYDFACRHGDWVRTTFNNITIYRTWEELNGKDAVPNEVYADKKSICTSRSFGRMISALDELHMQVACYAARCAEKLRMQKTVASVVGVFIKTNDFREDLTQYWNFREIRLLTPTNATMTIVQAAGEALKQIYRVGYQYKKAGVVVMGIQPDAPIQQDLFDIRPEAFKKMKSLDRALDHINRVYGAGTVALGVRADAVRHDFRSPNPTTRWKDLIKLK